ncbi:MAG: amidohydrolase family protein [Candidatus Nezhaarchaeales archaeon]
MLKARSGEELRALTVKLGSRSISVIDVHVHPKIIPMNKLIDPERLVEEMDKAGVDKAVLLAVETDPVDFDRFMDEERKKEACLEYYRFYRRSYAYILDEGLLLYEFSTEVKRLLNLVNTTNEAVKKYVDKYPERFIGFGSLNPNKPRDYVDEKIRLIKAYGFKGIKLLPTIQFFNPEDLKMEMVYEKAEKEGLILLMHTGCDPGPWEVVCFSRDANPKYLDKVARNHPNLVIIAAHMGSYSALEPGIWFNEMVTVLKGNENVYADVSAVDEALIKRALELGVSEDKILYGSDYPAVSGWCDTSTGMGNPVKAILNLDVKDEVKEKILGGNAKRLLGL